MEVKRLNCWVKDRKDRKSFNDPVTALEWSQALQDFTVRARHVAGNLAAHNWDVTVIGKRLLLHCHWGKGKWFDKGSDQPTPMTDDEQAALHHGDCDRYGVPPQPDFAALVAKLQRLAGCDCQCPEPQSGVAGVSESCPIHAGEFHVITTVM
jgi:hypothetical protein